MTLTIPAVDIEARAEVWPLREAFTISRGSKTAAHVVTVTARSGAHTGHGEAVPYARYGETVDGVLAQIREAAPRLQAGDALDDVLLAGAARNAIDCALWDLEAKRSGISAAQRAGHSALRPVTTAYTLSLDTPEAMARKAVEVRDLPLLKLKLGGAGDADRLRAVRAARPDARLIADANEAWTLDMLAPLLAVAAETQIEVVEQPLAAKADEALRTVFHDVPICADESIHSVSDLPRLTGLYDAINIKLDKTGGLTGALALHHAARACDMMIMVGSMVGTSLAVAPAMLLAQDAEWIDLDGPLLLAQDRDHGFQIRAGVMSPADARLWG